MSVDPGARTVVGAPGEVLDDLNARLAEHGDDVRARFPDIPRRVSGYNLGSLLPEHGFDVARALVGSEGTPVTILRASSRSCPS